MAKFQIRRVRSGLPARDFELRMVIEKAGHFFRKFERDTVRLIALRILMALCAVLVRHSEQGSITSTMFAVAS